MKSPSLPLKHSKIQEEFTDDSLLAHVKDGNREAIKILFADLAVRLKSGGIHDRNVINMLIDIFDKIGKGESPDEAFKWKQPKRGRPTSPKHLRDYLIKMSVQDKMKNGASWLEACEAVSSANKDGCEFHLGAKSIEKICEHLDKNSFIPLPEDVFPF